jgi:hypothetical protein
MQQTPASRLFASRLLPTNTRWDLGRICRASWELAVRQLFSLVQMGQRVMYMSIHNGQGLH